MKPLDLTGRRVNTLNVVRRVGRTKHRTPLWECLCDCGQTVIHPRGNICRGRVACRDCRFKNPNKIVLHELYASYRRRAGTHSRDFTLDETLFEKLIRAACHYCGNAPTQILRVVRRQNTEPYNGIDRVDNSQGYIPGNVVTCCGECNRRKHTSNGPDFIAWVARAYTHLKSAGAL